jgi:GTPase SAR1 family protein
MKLMFVGMEGVGKTTLFKKLRGHETKASDSIFFLILEFFEFFEFRNTFPQMAWTSVNGQ